MKKLIVLLTLFVFFISFAIAQVKVNKPADKKQSTATELYVIGADGKISLTLKGASFIAKWNLENFHKEFPHNRVSYWESPEDMGRPKDLNPAFYGYADWHSAVHSHWTMVKLLKLFPNLPEGKQIREILDKTLDTANISGELRFFMKEYNVGFEYPYGQSWLLKLAAELHSWDDPKAKEWYFHLLPLTKFMEAVYYGITNNQPLADRYGHHENSAFGLINGWDYAVEMKNDNFKKVIYDKALKFYYKDVDAPVLYEPSVGDFLSPNYLEAAIMSKVTNPAIYKDWLKDFMPGFMDVAPARSFEPMKMERNSHLKGYNLTKAFCINTILKQIDKADPKYKKVKDASHRLVQETLPQLLGGNFDDSHWLGSFILLAITSDE
jgi:hypothetical protein